MPTKGGSLFEIGRRLCGSYSLLFLLFPRYWFSFAFSPFFSFLFFVLCSTRRSARYRMVMLLWEAGRLPFFVVVYSVLVCWYVYACVCLCFRVRSLATNTISGSAQRGMPYEVPAFKGDQTRLFSIISCLWCVVESTAIPPFYTFSFHNAVAPASYLFPRTSEPLISSVTSTRKPFLPDYCASCRPCTLYRYLCFSFFVCLFAVRFCLCLLSLVSVFV